MLEELAPTEDGVSEERIEPRGDNGMANGFAGAQPGAERARRFRRIAARRLRVFQVRLKLGVDIAIYATAEYVGDAGPDRHEDLLTLSAAIAQGQCGWR